MKFIIKVQVCICKTLIFKAYINNYLLENRLGKFKTKILLIRISFQTEN